MKKRIVTTTAVFEAGYPAEKAADRLASLGFEALDMAFDYCTKPGSPFLEDGYLSWAGALSSRRARGGLHGRAPDLAGGGQDDHRR